MAFETDPSFDKPVNKPLIGVAVLVVLIVAAGGWYLHSRGSGLPAVPQAAPRPVAPPPTAPAIEHPIPADAPGAEPKPPLPALADSDSALKDALNQAAGSSALEQYLVPDSIVRHVVVTVDNLPRQKVALDKRPVSPTPGRFLAQGDELHGTLDEQNFARYRPLVEVVRNLDMQHLAAVYFRFYPLFQQTYQDLGYPNGYFNDRLVQVIDVLLATPQPAGPIELVRPNVMYLYADPQLESLPAGQKLLIRMGPDNAAAIKKKLKELRAIIVATAPRS